MPTAKKAPAKKAASAKKAAPKKATDAALTKFEATFAESYGAGTLTRSPRIVAYKAIPTGSLDLDIALGVGGWLIGRLHEAWGPDGVGKTTLASMTVAEAQRMFPDKMVAYVDVEHKADKPWFAAHGVNLARMYLFQPDTAEDVADAVKDMIRSGVISLIVIDSIGAMIPEAEKEKDADKAVMAQQAKIITRMVKIAASEAPKTDTTVLMINQVRANLAYGGDTTTGGGFALKHVTTTKVKVKRTGSDPFKTTVNGEAGTIVGHEIAIYVERNGVAPAYRTAMVTLFNQDTKAFGPIGIDKADEAFKVGLRFRVIEQGGGGYYTLPGFERVRGRDAVLALLREHPKAVADIRTKALAAKAGDLFAEEISPEMLEEIETDATEHEPVLEPDDNVPAKAPLAFQKVADA